MKDTKMTTDSSSLDSKMQVDKKSTPAAEVPNPAIGAGDDAATKVVTKSTNPGSVLKQDLVSKVLASEVAGAPTVSGGNALRGSWRASSGSVDGALGTSEATPKGRNTRGESRFDRKVEKVATKVNFTPSEQYEKNYVEAKPLAQAADKVQGYPGNYRNELYRTQKVAGSSPAELNYDRSVDFIEKDQIYFGMGQQILANSSQAGSFDPEKVYDVADAEWKSNTNRITRTNFLPRSFDIAYDQVDDASSPILTYFKINGVSNTPHFDRDLFQAASPNSITEINKIEVTREEMESKAGDEDKEGWSPLPKGIEDPNGWLALLHAYEAMTGNEVFISKAKLGTALSFYMNKTAKDGQNIETPAVEAFLGCLRQRANSIDYGSTVSDVYSTSNIRRGSAGAFIRAFDSIAKYKNKGDFLVQPRSIKMHYNTAQNNCDPLHFDPRFVKAFEKNECYSTIDRDYDPTLPVMMTDKAGLMYPFDLSQVSEYSCFNILAQDILVKEYTGGQATAGFAEHKLGRNKTGENMTIYYKYGKRSGDTSLTHNDGHYTATTSSTNKTVTLTADSTTNGADAEHLDIKLTNTDGYTSLTIPADYTFIVQLPLETGTKVLIDTVLKPVGATSLTYGYKDRNNWYYIDVKLPLVSGLIRFFQDNGASFSNDNIYGLGMRNLPICHSTRYITLWDTLICAATPYIVQERINSVRGIIDYESDHGYPFADLATLGGHKDPAFENFNFSSFEQPLTCGRMNDIQSIKWTMPEFFCEINTPSVGDSNYEYLSPWYVCESDYKQLSGTYKLTHKGYNGQEATEFSICWPSTRAGIKLDALTKLQGIDERELRLSLDIITDITDANNNDFTYPRAYKYGRSTDGQVVFTTDGGLTINQLLSMPRQLGWVMDAPGGCLTPDNAHYWDEMSYNSNYHGATSFRCYYYTNSTLEAGKAILAKDDAAITRAANFTQVWHCIDTISPALGQTQGDYGVLLGVSMAFDGGSARSGKASFSPYGLFGSGAQDTNSDAYPTLFGTHRYLYARLQQLPFIISPFDTFDIVDGGATGCDIYDIAYIFGLCGFRQSNYDEDLYNKDCEAHDLGFLFVEDPWYRDSVLSK